MGRAEAGSDRLWRLEARAAGVGAASGLVAGIAMGLVLQFGTDLLAVLGGLLGEPSVIRGWIVHLLVSVVYGVVFAVIVAYPPVRGFMDPHDAADYVFGGVVYAAMILAAGAFGTIAVLPFAQDVPWAAGSVRSTDVPGPALGGLFTAALFSIGHLVYGAVLGAVYAYLADSTG